MPEEPKQPEPPIQNVNPMPPADPGASLSPENPPAMPDPVHQSGQVITPTSPAGNQSTAQQASQPAVSPSSTDSAAPTPPAVAPSVIGTVPPVPPDTTEPQSQYVANHPPVTSQPGKKKRGKFIIALIAVVLVLLLAGGYVFAFYLPNTPSSVFATGLSNTGLALDKLVDYSKTQQQANYNSVSTSGSIHVKSPSGSYDVTASGSGDKHGNATGTIQADILGENITANVRSIVSKGNTTPDVYVQVNGIKSFLDSLGGSSLDKYNDQWIEIDHTLIDTYTSSLKSALATSDSAANASQVPTYAEIQDAISKVQTVNKQYLFTTSSSTAVLTNQKYLGQQSVNGTTQNEYQVGYNKSHLEAYVSAVSTALDASQLNTWSKLANKGQSLSQVMDFSSLTKAVQNAKSDYTFYIWIDKSTKVISKIEFADPSDNSMKFTISQNYTGGNVYPFTMGLTGKDSAGNTDNVTVGLTLNTTTNKVNMTFSSTGGTTSASGNFVVTPSKNFVQVTAPAGAKSLTGILLSLGLNANALAGTSGIVQPGGTNINYTGPLIPVNSQ